MNQIKLLFIITFCFTQSTFGQNTDSTITNSIPSELYGIWYLQYKYNGVYDTLTFSRTCHAPNGWGQRIEIDSDGNFVDAYSAKCGNDDAIHHSTGNWI
jgi:hypothetical protein